MKGTYMKNVVLAGLVGILATGALAHSPLERTVPADQMAVADVPTEIIMVFKSEMRLTRVTMAQADTELDLDLSGHDGFITDYAIPLEATQSGTYSIMWRGLGVDGHALNGTFAFVVE